MALTDHEKEDIRAMVREEVAKALEEQLKPFQSYIQGAAGLGILWKVFVSVGGALLLYFQIQERILAHGTTAVHAAVK